MAFTLVGAVDETIDVAEYFLLTFDNMLKPVIGLIGLALTIQLLWVGMEIALGGKQTVQELILKMRRLWLAALLSNASMGLVPGLSPLHEVAREIRDDVVQEFMLRYEVKTESMIAAIVKLPAELEKAEYGLSEDDIKKAKNDLGYVAYDAVYSGQTTCVASRCASLISKINQFVNVDAIFAAGAGISIVMLLLFSASLVAGGVTSFIIMGNGSPAGWLIVLGLLAPIFSSILGLGLMMCGWALAITISFFMLDIQLRILSHLAPIFLLGYAFDATKSYAEGWAKALIKNVFGSIFMVFFTLLSAKMIASANGQIGGFFFALCLFFASSRYAQQLAADLVGGFATPSEDLSSTGSAVRGAGQHVEQAAQGTFGTVSSYYQQRLQAEIRSAQQRTAQAVAGPEPGLGPAPGPAPGPGPGPAPAPGPGPG